MICDTSSDLLERLPDFLKASSAYLRLFGRYLSLFSQLEMHIGLFGAHLNHSEKLPDLLIEIPDSFETLSTVYSIS